MAATWRIAANNGAAPAKLLGRSAAAGGMGGVDLRRTR